MIEKEKSARVAQILATGKSREDLAEALWLAERSERVAYHIGWLTGFSGTIWSLVGTRMSDDMAAEYDRIVSDLRETLLVKEDK